MPDANANMDAPQAQPFLADAAQPAALADFLAARGVLTGAERPVTVERAGDGNMNLTLRVRTTAGTLIVKQGRPWVEKYPHIPAPADRSLVEAAFYRAVAATPGVASRMPRLLHLDAGARLLVLEDVGSGGDYTDLYAGAPCPDGDLETLTAYLAALHAMPLPDRAGDPFENRAMRGLNHEHIFRFPLSPDNGLDLDALTPGLGAAARQVMADTTYVQAVSAAGEAYLDGDRIALVHGDFFPGSWLRGPRGPWVIDPEFCFVGRPEFDLGVMTAHMLFAKLPGAAVTRVARLYAARHAVEAALVDAFAGIEIMRRLIGVAQLPLRRTLDEKRELLDLSRALVCRHQRLWAT